MNTTDTLHIWEEDVLIPTYGIGQPDKNPMFLENRVYQGSSGVVYPYPVIEKIEDYCADKSYHAVFLENEYIKVMVLPELGGRVQMAYDKIKQRHFVYYNSVIKPALVGLTGPWISGGIEFNWPQHHRPSTFLPVDWHIERHPDRVTLWVNERERMFHQKGMAGFTLRRGRAVLEIEGRAANPTPLPQTFLWWANPAVAVNDHYRSIFPSDVTAVYDHGRRDVSTFPIATGTYYKVDYSAGVDISCYKNLPVPTSYMAVNSKYNFLGGYEDDTRAGMLHVADHHVSPGKKQWTWGNGDFGQAWDRNLTDHDGPYIELMAGVFTDNQPDFTWLQPYEEKRFKQYFLPYRELGAVKNASADLLLNIELADAHTAIIKLFATSRQNGLTITVRQNSTTVYEKNADLSPEEIFEDTVPTGSLQGVEVSICTSSGKALLSWRDEKSENAVPEPAKPALLPSEIADNEELFLTGLHLEQYRHATFNPTDYYEEALRRNPTDYRCNNAMGLWLIRHAQPAKAELYLRRAVETLMVRNSNPYDSEPLYNLGLSLKLQGKADEAYDWFLKSCWSMAFKAQGYFSAAQISAARGDWQQALEETGSALVYNLHNGRARHLKTAALRHLGNNDEALEFIGESLAIDPFNYGCGFEKYLITHNPQDLAQLLATMRREGHNYQELLLDYADAAMWPEALLVADMALRHTTSERTLIYYYKAWCLLESGETEKADAAIDEAESQTADYCFPNAIQAATALSRIINFKGRAPKARYALGNLYYDKRQYTDAVEQWEKSMSENPKFPTVLRNLSLAYFNKFDKPSEALLLLEHAVAIDPADARILMELDQLYKRLNRPHNERLALLDKKRELVAQRDDLYLEYITLLNQTGRHDEALSQIDSHKFHPWEGGEGKVTEQYQIALTELAKQQIHGGNPGEALRLLERCYAYPENLGEGKLRGARENDFDYWRGIALKALGRTDEATRAFESAAQGEISLGAAIFYNDQKPDKIFYQALALAQLGNDKEARRIFRNFTDYGTRHISDKFKMDYFAVSNPDLQIWNSDLNLKNRVHCLYMMALGLYGQGKSAKAAELLREAASLDNNNQGVQLHLAMINNEIR